MNMPNDMSWDDATLMAYADGELDVAQAELVRQAMHADAAIAARVEQHRALRARMQSELSTILGEPVPERLLNTLQARPSTQVVDLAQKRTQKTATRHWGNSEWLAMAASLLAGVVLGIAILNMNSDGAIATTRDGALLAQGRLDKALSMQSAANNSANETIKIGISFRNHAGKYCRSFTLNEANPLVGFACREKTRWRVNILAEAAANTTTEFRQAGSALPAAVINAVDAQISGEPLDAEAEAAALRAGWQ